MAVLARFEWLNRGERLELCPFLAWQSDCTSSLRQRLTGELRLS